MAFLTTFAVDGSRTPAAVARTMTFGATKEPGVVEPAHCKLVPLGGGSVGLQAGAVLIPAGTSGAARWQMYVAVVDSTDGNATATVTMPSATSRTLQAVITVPDPQWAGVPAPADPLTAVYAELRLLTDAEFGSLTMPNYRVATVVIPANATAITAAMITERRRVARPRKDRTLFAYSLVTADGTHSLTTTNTGGQWWPNLGGSLWQVYVPPWATKANILATWNGVLVRSSAATGFVWARLGSAPGSGQGTVDTQHQRFDLATSASGSARESWTLADDVTVIAGLRGTTQSCRTLGYRLDADTVPENAPRLTNVSSVSFDIEFREAAI